jgi:hypothetical protein
VKVLITIDDNTLNDYQKISPLNGDNPLFLDKYLDDGECQEIILDGIIDYVPIEHTQQYVTSLAKKLKIGGKLIIIGIDALEVAQSYYNGIINTIQFNKLTFGEKRHTWEFKQGLVQLEELCELLKSLNLKIINKRLYNFKYSITVERS